MNKNSQKDLFHKLLGVGEAFLNWFSLLCAFFLEITCSPLSAIAHGGFYPVKKIYEEGDVVHFFCERNYSLSEFDLIQCYYFGWHPDPPVCEGTLFLLRQILSEILAPSFTKCFMNTK